MRFIGTAGHVDHVKSALVEVLSGVHPDRLKEEREREMTIDLGFAWFTLPNGGEVGIVDVPGHRDFIENMLAGIGGIDAVLFVIAADEGVMPQTKEHLAILDLLKIQGGVIALTKIDLVPDADWLELVEEDIRQVCSGTVLDNAPIIRVSARTREGVQNLLAAIEECLANRPERLDSGKPRLPVDRVFTIAGFGTVVTGTLSDGSLRVGDEVEILPSGHKGRVRGLQTHKKKEDFSTPGSRTAVNISGVTVDQIQRGDVVAHPGTYRPTGRVDASFRLLRDVSQSLKHNTEVKLFIGAAEILARIRLLGCDELLPGQSGWIQLETKLPVLVMRGDRYILRRPSPGETLGGGEIIDPHPKGRHKRFAAQTITRLEALAQGTPDEVLLQAVVSLGAASVKDVIQVSHLEKEVALSTLKLLVASGQVINLDHRSSVTGEEAVSAADQQPSDFIAGKGFVDQLTSKTLFEVSQYHRIHPLKSGMPREELKSRLKVSPRLFSALIQKIVDEKLLVEIGPLVKLAGHEITFSPQQEKAIDQLLAQFAAAPYSPPTIKECQSQVGDDVYYALVDQGVLIPMNQEIVFNRMGYEQLVADVRSLIMLNGQITAAQMRDYWNTSRRYVLALLEYLDRIGVTARDGDIRKLRK